jgi:ADP-ribose pyrophosphatase
MSKFFFQLLAPSILIGATAYFLEFAPAANQKLVLGYAWATYLIISGWRLLVDRSSPSSEGKPMEKLGGEIPRALQELVLQEYEYIRETMAQAMNDRHTMVNYFLLATGVVLAAISAIYSAEGMSYSPYKNYMTIAICLIFNLISWIYLMMVIRLRQAWCESAAAMNRVKNFVLLNHNLSEQDSASPFRWKSANTPAAAKKGTLYHFAVILISIVSSSGLALVSLLLLGPELESSHFWLPTGWFLYNFILQNSAYGIFLKEINRRERAVSKPDFDQVNYHSENNPNHGHAIADANSTSKDQTHLKLQPHRMAPHQAGMRAGASPKVDSILPQEILSQRPKRVVVQKEETILRDFFTVRKATLQFEKYDGRLSAEMVRLNLVRGDSSAILLRDEAEHEFVFVEQFRYPAFDYNRENGWLIEAVAGKVDEGETPHEAALREAHEETGYEVLNLEKLAEFYVSPGGSAERVFVFWGKLGARTGTGGGKGSEHENIRVVRLPMQQAYQLLDAGFFEDAKTIIALQTVRDRVMRRPS